MSGLLFSVGAVATGSAVAGGIARTAGFKDLDDINLDAIYDQFQDSMSQLYGQKFIGRRFARM